MPFCILNRVGLRVEQLETRAAPAVLGLSQLASPAGVSHVQLQTVVGAVKEAAGAHQPAGIIAILIG